MKIGSLIVTDQTRNSCQSYKIIVEDNVSELDVKTAIKKAIAEYCETEDGKKKLNEINGYFTIDDFVNYVPDSYCLKNGIYILPDNNLIIQINSNEILYEESI